MAGSGHRGFHPLITRPSQPRGNGARIWGWAPRRGRDVARHSILRLPACRLIRPSFLALRQLGPLARDASGETLGYEPANIPLPLGLLSYKLAPRIDERPSVVPPVPAFSCLSFASGSKLRRAWRVVPRIKGADGQPRRSLLVIRRSRPSERQSISTSTRARARTRGWARPPSGWVMRLRLSDHDPRRRARQGLSKSMSGGARSWRP